MVKICSHWEQKARSDGEFESLDDKFNNDLMTLYLCCEGYYSQMSCRNETAVIQTLNSMFKNILMPHPKTKINAKMLFKEQS